MGNKQNCLQVHITNNINFTRLNSNQPSMFFRLKILKGHKARKRKVNLCENEIKRNYSIEHTFHQPDRGTK